MIVICSNEIAIPEGLDGKEMLGYLCDYDV